MNDILSGHLQQQI